MAACGCGLGTCVLLISVMRTWARTVPHKHMRASTASTRTGVERKRWGRGRDWSGAAVQELAQERLEAVEKIYLDMRWPEAAPATAAAAQ